MLEDFVKMIQVMIGQIAAINKFLFINDHKTIQDPETQN